MNTAKSLVLLLTAIVLACSGSHLAFAAAQTTCPVLDNQIDKRFYTDYQGKRIYFCCPPCADTFNKDPEAYMKKLRESNQEPAAAPGS